MAIEDKTRQDNIRTYKTIQDNTVSYKTRQDETIQDNTVQYKTISDKTRPTYNQRMQSLTRYSTTR